ncbi:ABC transporter ATP-binding protein [Alicyclobacillus fastidiosus]|uniref:ABC transporter ATP-binding protein n=1 Tax=Alicyclobacillus fastidiosus TaxID=392011 RepID=A0ABY6ZPT3_9BACL|nr:ABC transporter ATP-binding protein [Alicyclobacillus fastidiosus]WAH44096.1 ABC transporter ATP-binding protein [Alicyclobacillus fastidiosus]GMA60391.1 peptide ABC transporter ATP-binding protein [Alicyclobacillus fastidiosus]
MAEDLLTVENLYTQFERTDDTVYAVNGVSFSVAPGETLGIVGESGSGKSVSLLSVLGLLRGTGRVMSGTAKFMGTNLLKLRRRQLEDIRGRDIGVVFQDPMSSLNPTMRIGDQIMEAMLTHQYTNRKGAFARTLDLLEEVGIPEPKTRFRNYPHEFSGGMRQRVMIAMAIACEPQLLIADEPTTALDVTVQMQILSLLQKLRDKRRMSIVMITHDFGVATNFCDRIIVMYAGKVMESASLDEFLKRPAHPYTIGLKASIIEVGHRDKELRPIPGMADTLNEVPQSCPYAARCRFAQDRCRQELPELRHVGANHYVACHRAEEVMADVG